MMPTAGVKHWVIGTPPAFRKWHGEPCGSLHAGVFAHAHIHSHIFLRLGKKIVSGVPGIVEAVVRKLALEMSGVSVLFLVRICLLNPIINVHSGGKGSGAPRAS
eukprot:scaffold70982_cov62-Attheya_sp.AAC.4